MSEDTVWVAIHPQTPASIWHHDPECRTLTNSKAREITRDQASVRDLDECQYCSGEYERTDPDFSIYMAAKRAGQERADD